MNKHLLSITSCKRFVKVTDKIIISCPKKVSNMFFSYSSKQTCSHDTVSRNTLSLPIKHSPLSTNLRLLSTHTIRNVRTLPSDLAANKDMK